MSDITQGELAVFRNGRIVFYLSRELVAQQKLSKEEVKRLVTIHSQRLSVSDELRNADLTDREKVHDLLDLIEYHEFLLQAVWKFKLDSSYHLWRRVPHCSCAKHSWPSKVRNYSPNCKVHFDRVYTS